MQGGVIGGLQAGDDWKSGAEIGALLGAGGGLIEHYGAARAAKAAERQLSFPPSTPTRTRIEVSERAVKPGARVPITRAEELKGFPHLEPEIARNKGAINRLTQTHPVYSQRTIPIDQVLQPVDRYIARLRRSDPQAAEHLARLREQWATELGYKPAVPAVPATPARIVQEPILDINGKPLLDQYGKPLLRDRTIPGAFGKPGVPAQTTTTVAKTQTLKEDFRAGLAQTQKGKAPTLTPPGETTGRRLAESGMKRSIENAIPEEAIKDINHAIEIDLRLKEAIIRVSRKNPAWLGSTLKTMAGEAGLELGAELLQRMGGEGQQRSRRERGQPGMLTPGRMALGAAAALTMAYKNPRAWTTLMVALRASGVAMPGGVGTFIGSQIRTGGGASAPALGRERYEQPEPEVGGGGATTSAPPPVTPPATTPATAPPASGAGGGAERTADPRYELPEEPEPGGPREANPKYELPEESSLARAPEKKPSPMPRQAATVPPRQAATSSPSFPSEPAAGQFPSWDRTRDFLRDFQQIGPLYGASPGLLRVVAHLESSGNPDAKGGSGEVGLMQLMPSTARSLGVDPRDPRDSIRGAAQLLGRLMRKYNGVTWKVLAAYNEGEPAFDRRQRKSPGRQSLPATTQRYVANGLRLLRGQEIAEAR